MGEVTLHSSTTQPAKLIKIYIFILRYLSGKFLQTKSLCALILLIYTRWWTYNDRSVFRQPEYLYMFIL